MLERDRPGLRESHELLQPCNPAWLAGIFEVGGAIYFEIRSTRKESGVYTYSYPFLKLTDKDPNKMQRFQRIVGGRVNVNKRTGSSNWYIMGKSAVDLTTNMSSHAPSRRAIIEAFENWEVADKVERIGIAQEMMTHNRIDIVEQGDYEDLVRDPDFLAGVIDSRGSIYMCELVNASKNPLRRGLYGWVFPKLNIHSTNIFLLEALKNEYGGYVGVAYRRGEEVKKFNREYVSENTSAQWQAGHKTCKELAQMVGGRVALLLEGIQLIQTSSTTENH